MKAFFLVSLLIVAASASVLQDHAVKFQEFKMIHGKNYPNQEEETKRFSIFRDNLRAIEEHNALYEKGLVSYKQKITKFADKTQEEFKAYLGLHTKPTLKTNKYVRNKGVKEEIPDSVDWREKGQVTAVKDQGNCSSSWAFSITGITEAAYYRKNGELVSLSAQQLVDCAKDLNKGCDGGYVVQTLPYVKESGLQSEETYPYEAENKSCRYSPSDVVTKISNYHHFNIEDESGVLEAVATIGPVTAAMNADYLRSYASGIFHDNRCSEININHSVLIVGYGSENGTDYWLVKNSWGTQWGEDGYFRIRRGTNECLIAENCLYTII